MNDRKYYIDAVKVLAVLLVLNSHMDSIYPISALAVGGALGNALFFFVSGYTWSNIHSKDFGQWYTGKIRRVYSPTIITNIAYILIFESALQLHLLDYFKLFVYPNKSWFCGAILLYALFYYWVAKKAHIKYVYRSVVATLIVYIAYYIMFLDKSTFALESMQTGGLCRIAFYFVCMLTGLLYKNLDNKRKARNGVLLPSALAISMFAASFVFKLCMNQFPILLEIQFMCQLTTLASAYCFFDALKKSENVLKKLPFKRGIVVISDYSWEIYLVQTLIIPKCTRFIFPINLCLTIVLVIICAWVLRFLMTLHSRKGITR